MLKEYAKVQKEDQLRAGDKWVNTDRIFTQWNGESIHPDSITGWFREFIQKTDLPQVSIHSLRHTNITLLIAAGVPLRTVSYRAAMHRPLPPQISIPMRYGRQMRWLLMCWMIF
jgi:integrase